MITKDCIKPEGFLTYFATSVEINSFHMFKKTSFVLKEFFFFIIYYFLHTQVNNVNMSRDITFLTKDFWHILSCDMFSFHMLWKIQYMIKGSSTFEFIRNFNINLGILDYGCLDITCAKNWTQKFFIKKKKNNKYFYVPKIVPSLF